MKKRILAIFMLVVVFITNVDFKLAKAYGSIIIIGGEGSEEEFPKIKESTVSLVYAFYPYREKIILNIKE